MVKRFVWLSFSLLSIMFISSCSSDEPGVTTTDFGFEFFPLQVGNFREYEVLEVNFLTAGPDSNRFFLRESITDSIVSEQIVNYILERAIRENSSDPWVVDSVWTTRRTNREAIQVENNIPIVKIEFPVIQDGTWDANAFNNRGEMIYTSQFIDSDTIDNTLQVIIADIEANFVLQDQRNEFYARGIGLINRDFINVRFDQDDTNPIRRIESGRVLDQRLIRYGKD